MSLVSIDDFKKIELRTAKILKAEELPGADRLWKLFVDVGTEQKTIVAGIKLHYPAPDQLVGKSIVVLNNLQPAVIRGVESNGMLLAAKSEAVLTLLILDKDVPPGSVIG